MGEDIEEDGGGGVVAVVGVVVVGGWGDWLARARVLAIAKNKKFSFPSFDRMF